jgi:hypothetical protein
MRLGEESQDLADVRILIRSIGLQTLTEAELILGRYYALERYPAKTRYILEELLSAKAPQSSS